MARTPKRTPKPQYAENPKRMWQGRVKTDEANERRRWRPLILIGDSNMEGAGVRPTDLPSPPNTSEPIPNFYIYDRIKLENPYNPAYKASIRALTTGYGGGTLAPWHRDSLNVGPEWFLAERFRAYSSVNTLILKLGVGGSGTGYRNDYTWDPDNGTDFSLLKIFNESYWVPAMEELRERVGGNSSLIADPVVVCLLGTNDASPEETAKLYGVRMLGLIEKLRFSVKPDGPTKVAWINVQPPTYMVNGKPFAFIESIQSQCRRLSSRPNVEHLEIPNPQTHAHDPLHLDAIGCRSMGWALADRILSVSKFV